MKKLSRAIRRKRGSPTTTRNPGRSGTSTDGATFTAALLEAGEAGERGTSLLPGAFRTSSATSRALTATPTAAAANTARHPMAAAAQASGAPVANEPSAPIPTSNPDMVAKRAGEYQRLKAV